MKKNRKDNCINMKMVLVKRLLIIPNYCYENCTEVMVNVNDLHCSLEMFIHYLINLQDIRSSRYTKHVDHTAKRHNSFISHSLFVGPRVSISRRLGILYMSIKCHHTVTVSTVQYLQSHYCGVELTSTPITVKTIL